MARAIREYDLEILGLLFFVAGVVLAVWIDPESGSIVPALFSGVVLMVVGSRLRKLKRKLEEFG
jgi:uncharacterized membrane protein HdeD (DUF308 family)